MPTRLTVVLLVLVAPALAQEPRREDPLPGVVEREIMGVAPSEMDGEVRDRVTDAIQAGDYERAQALLLEAIETQPRSPEALRLLGGVFFLRNRPLNAAIAFKKAEALAPLDERSRFTLAMAYVALGRRDWARPELQKLRERDSQNPLYPYWTARLDYDDGHYATAIEGLRRAVELDPGFMKAHDNLGLCYDMLGRFDEATRSFEVAIRLNREAQPQSPWPTLNYGAMLVRLNRLDEAEASFRESLEVDPRFAQAHYQLGLVLEKKGRPEAAIREHEEAARLDPGYAEPQYALSRLHRRSGDVEKADRALERFREIKREEGRPGPP